MQKFLYLGRSQTEKRGKKKKKKKKKNSSGALVAAEYNFIAKGNHPEGFIKSNR